MYLRIVTTLLSSLLLWLAAGVASADDSSRTAEDIRQCSRKNFPVQTSTQKFDLRSTDAVGGEMDLQGKLNWRKGEDGMADINICFHAPPKFSGTCYLVMEKENGDDIFVYLPALQRVKRVMGSASSQSLLGTDISYEDLKQLQNVAAGGALTRLPDGQVGELPVYVLEGKPAASDESPYTRVVSHIDKTTCVPLQVDFYELGDAHRKQLSVVRESLVAVDGRWQIHKLRLRDVRDDSETSIELGDVEVDADIANRVFNRNSFYLSN